MTENARLNGRVREIQRQAQKHVEVVFSAHCTTGESLLIRTQAMQAKAQGQTQDMVTRLRNQTLSCEEELTMVKDQYAVAQRQYEER